MYTRCTLDSRRDTSLRGRAVHGLCGGPFALGGGVGARAGETAQARCKREKGGSVHASGIRVRPPIQIDEASRHPVGASAGGRGGRWEWGRRQVGEAAGGRVGRWARRQVGPSAGGRGGRWG